MRTLAYEAEPSINIHVRSSEWLAKIKLLPVLNEFFVSQLRILLFTAPKQMPVCFGAVFFNFKGCLSVGYHVSLYFNWNKSIICNLAGNNNLHNYYWEALLPITKKKSGTTYDYVVCRRGVGLRSSSRWASMARCRPLKSYIVNFRGHGYNSRNLK